MGPSKRGGPWAAGALSAVVACALGCAAGSPATEREDGDGDGGASGTGMTTASGDGGAGDSSGTGGAGGTASCAYPTGNVGVLEGMLVDGTLSWSGFPAGADAIGTMESASLFDCDGSKGIHGVLVVESATWCGPCQQEAAGLQAKMDASWKALGIRVIELMVQDASEQAATVDTANAWKESFGLHDVAVGADPGFSFDYFDFDKHISGGYFPTAIVVDPRTMTVVARQPGPETKDLHAIVEDLAKKNAAP